MATKDRSGKCSGYRRVSMIQTFQSVNETLEQPVNPAERPLLMFTTHKAVSSGASFRISGRTQALPYPPTAAFIAKIRYILTDATARAWLEERKVGLVLTASGLGNLEGVVHPGLNSCRPGGSITALTTQLPKWWDQLDYGVWTSRFRPEDIHRGPNQLIVNLGLTAAQIQRGPDDIDPPGAASLARTITALGRAHEGKFECQQFGAGHRAIFGAPGGEWLNDPVIEPCGDFLLECCTIDLCGQLLAHPDVVGQFTSTTWLSVRHEDRVTFFDPVTRGS
jgi:hypothetical protein